MKLYFSMQRAVEFWRQRVSKPDDVKPVKNNQRLRFFIATDDDFRRFHQAVTGVRDYGIDA